MPYERPGAGVYVTATKTTKHNDPATENGLVGVAVKQKPIPWGASLAEHQAMSIAIGEGFHIRTKGVKEFPTDAGEKAALLAAALQGQGVYIRAADNTLHLEGATAAGDLPFGRVVEVVGMTRGVPPNRIRIDLDQKDTLAAA